MPSPTVVEGENQYLHALNLIFPDNFSFLWASYQKLIASGVKKPFSTLWQRLGPEKTKNLDLIKEWKQLQQENIRFISILDPEYPALLKEISYPPLGLYLKGQLPLNKPALAVVGTRKFSNYGKLVTEKLVKDLVAHQLIIVSGLAYGIDTLAHKTALENQGITLAVLGAGFHHIFPSLNQSLANQIIQTGALITEYAPNLPPLKHHFPWRNRIISGLTLGTLVIEAKEKSGALITSRFALEQNREVFAVPGSIFNPTSLGTNHLIQEGAKLVCCLEDILAELNLPITDATLNENQQSIIFNNPEEEQIYRLLKAEEPTDIDSLVEKTNLEINKILIYLTDLEIRGLIQDLGNSSYVIRI